MARAVLPAMLEQGGGSIVAITSCHSFRIVPHAFSDPIASDEAPFINAACITIDCGRSVFYHD